MPKRQSNTTERSLKLCDKARNEAQKSLFLNAVSELKRAECKKTVEKTHNLLEAAKLKRGSG